MNRRITVVTSSNLVSTPRMLKAADAFSEAGYSVRVVYAEYVDWAIKAGERVRRDRTWESRSVNWQRDNNPFLYHRSRLRQHIFRSLVLALPGEIIPLSWLVRATARVGLELAAAIQETPSDLIYGGTGNGLGIVQMAAKKLGVPFSLDLEDFHTSELTNDLQGRRTQRLIGEIERRVLPEAKFVTTSSHPIAEAYEKRYGLRPTVIHNVFRCPMEEPDFSPSPDGVLRLFWFSQVIGPGRGLEDVVAAAGLLRQPVRLGLLGTTTTYSDRLVELSRKANPELQIEMLGHRTPDELLTECRKWDIGFATETGHPLNRELCVTNKITMYLVAGLAVAATTTAGQLQLAADLGPGAIYYRLGDVATLTNGLRRWADSPASLITAKRASWDAAVRRWHWDHALEKGQLLAAVAEVIGPPTVAPALDRRTPSRITDI